MRFKIIAIILAGVMGLQCQAATSAWYLTGEAGVATSNINKTDMDKALLGIQQARVVEVKDKGVAGALNLGYQLFEHFALELGYVDLGNRHTNIDALISPQADDFPAISKVFPESASGSSAAVVSRWQIVDSDFFLTLRLGYLDWVSKVKTESSRFAPITNKYQGEGIWGGLAVEIRLNDNWSSSLNIKRYELELDEINLYTMGAIYRF